MQINKKPSPYLLTPGPLTTSLATKKAMLNDIGSWDNDFKQITQEIREKLIQILSKWTVRAPEPPPDHQSQLPKTLPTSCSDGFTRGHAGSPFLYRFVYFSMLMKQYYFQRTQRCDFCEKQPKGVHPEV